MSSQPLTIDFLHQMRSVTDPVSDRVVADIIHSDEVSINDVFNHLTRNRDIFSAPLPEIVKKYFEENSGLPEWIDEDLVQVGQDVFRRYGVEVSMLLFFLSLPAAYACRNGAKVLVATGRLTDRDGDLNRFAHRLMETAQFVLDVMQPGAFQGNADGVVTALKVRLIHGAIRHFIREKGNWDAAKYGEPINQEDEAGTLMSFSSMIVHGLENMGVSLKPEEKEGYYHCWRVVGHIMGLNPKLVPETYEGGLAVGFQILDDQMGQSEDGKILVGALIDFVGQFLPAGFLRKYVPIFMIRYFIGKNIGNSLLFPQAPAPFVWFMDVMLKLFSIFLSILRLPRHHFVKRRIGKMKNHFLQKLIDYFNQHKKVFFDVPPSLRKNWNIDEDGKVIGVNS